MGFDNRPRNGGFGRDRDGGRSGGRVENFGGGRGGFSRGGSRGGFGGGRSGGFGDRRPLEMHDAVCDKCKKECQVPFRPSGDKPVLCSDCFRNEGGGSSSRSSFGSRGGFGRDRPSSSGSGMGGGISQDQFKQLNEKLDKIIAVLDSLEIISEEDEEGEGEDDEDAVIVDDEEDKELVDDKTLAKDSDKDSKDDLDDELDDDLDEDESDETKVI